MANSKAETGFGSWVANTVWGGGYQYAEYINSAGQTDIGIKADGAWNRLQYIPGVNFSKLYENNTGEITFGFDFVTPDNIADGKMIMEWGDGFTNKYQNIPFFAITKADDDHYSLLAAQKLPAKVILIYMRILVQFRLHCSIKAQLIPLRERYIPHLV